ncbi:hypothetical protein JZU48_04990, partial [bacterium]|nr:hypothetical protein [bacterium]
HSFQWVVPARLNRDTVERIELTKVAAGETVAGLAARMGRTPYAAQLLRALNGLADGEEPATGRPIKLVASD